MAIEPDCHFFNLSYIHLDRCMVLGADDGVPGGEFLWHVQVHEIVVLDVEGA